MGDQNKRVFRAKTAGRELLHENHRTRRGMVWLPIGASLGEAGPVPEGRFRGASFSCARSNDDVSDRSFPPLATAIFRPCFLAFQVACIYNSVSRTASRPTGCQIKYGGSQFDSCSYLQFR